MRFITCKLRRRLLEFFITYTFFLLIFQCNNRFDIFIIINYSISSIAVQISADFPGSFSSSGCGFRSTRRTFPRSSNDDRSRRKKRSIRRVIYFARRRTILSHRVRVYINIHRVSRRDSETRHSEIDAAASWPTSSTLPRPKIAVSGRKSEIAVDFWGFSGAFGVF